MRFENLLAERTERMRVSAIREILKVYWKAVEHKVAFVPGKFFFANPGEGLETMRLNYTMSNEAMLRRAIEILAEVMKQGIQSRG